MIGLKNIVVQSFILSIDYGNYLSKFEITV